MNKKLLVAVLGILIVGAAVYAYMRFGSNSEKHLSVVPEDAALLVGFDIKTISKKMEFDGKFKETKLFKFFDKEQKNLGDESNAERVFSEILKDPLNSGLAITNKLYMFVSNQNDIAYIGMVMGMKDEDRFVEMIKKISGLKSKLEKGKEISYYRISSSSILAWNDKALLLLNASNSWKMENADKQMLVMVENLLSQDKRKSILNSKYYSVDSKHDISFFMNYESYLKTFSFISGQNKEMYEMSNKFKDVYLAGGLTFENDKLAFTGKLTGDKKAIERIQTSKENGLSEMVLNCISKDKVLAMISGNLDVKKTINILDDLMGSKANIKMGLKSVAESASVRYEDLLDALSGELSFALTDFVAMNILENDYQYDEASGEVKIEKKEVVRPIPTLTLTLGVKNKEIIDAVCNKMIPIPMKNNLRVIKIPFLDSFYIYMVSKDKLLFLSNSADYGQTVNVNNKLGQLGDDEIKSMSKNNSGMFYLNLNTDDYAVLFDNMSTSQSDKTEINLFKSYMSIFKDFKGISKGTEMQYEINLKPGEGNSLFRILKQFDVLPIE